MVGRSRILAATLLGAVVLGGCGGGGGGEGPLPAAYSASFSPIRAVGGDGQPVLLRWRYQVNGGRPLVAQQDGMEMTIDMSAGATVEIDPVALVRRVEFPTMPLTARELGTSFAAQGLARMLATEDVRQGSRTEILSQALAFDFELTFPGEGTFQVGVDARSLFDVPAEWFPDRDDLDQLGIGTTYDERGSVTGTAHVTTSISGPGFPPQQRTTSDRFWSPEVWTIVDVLPSYQVLGATYEHVVVVERQTTGSDASGSGAPASRTITYWLARGIGMIKAEDLMPIYGQRPRFELVETNLRVP